MLAVLYSAIFANLPGFSASRDIANIRVKYCLQIIETTYSS